MSLFPRLLFGSATTITAKETNGKTIFVLFLFYRILSCFPIGLTSSESGFYNVINAISKKKNKKERQEGRNCFDSFVHFVYLEPFSCSWKSCHFQWRQFHAVSIVTGPFFFSNYKSTCLPGIDSRLTATDTLFFFSISDDRSWIVVPSKAISSI